MPARHFGRASLGQGLDREIYQIVLKLDAERSQYIKESDSRLNVPLIYEHIKRSNSSLTRKSKRLLEDSIERVLEVRKQDKESNNDTSDAEAASIDGRSELVDTAIGSDVANRMNRGIVDAWVNTSDTSKANASILINGAPKVGSPRSSKKRHPNEEPFTKRKRLNVAVDRAPPTHISLADLGGVDDVIQKLEDLVVLPLLQPDIYKRSNIKPPRGILLHGPPGCGKTMIANAFAAELGVPFISVSAPSVVSGMSGESEKALREYFEEAKNVAPCIVFIDEVDAITPKRESAQREMEKRIVAQLLTCMDELSLEKTGGKSVIVLAATNRPDSLDPALRRGGRFDKEINMGVPSEAVRGQILKALTRQMSISDALDFRELAKKTPGFVGADLNDLVSTAGSAAIKRFLDTLKTEHTATDAEETSDSISPQVIGLRHLIQSAKELKAGGSAVSVTSEDFSAALPKIQPSSKREGFATIPNTTWADIGALHPVREDLVAAIVEPIRNPDKYRKIGITVPAGVLLHGPPGCGKTLLAKAVANESGANFISVKGPELLNKYVGESEKAVKNVFVRAGSSVPCVIFFDELDALVPRRDESLSESSARVVNTLLTELDGLEKRGDIYVIAATNRRDIIDPAMLRPGRLGTQLLVDLPGDTERVEIMKTLSRKMSINYTDQIADIARDCKGFSGADLQSLLNEAGKSAIKRDDNMIRPEDVENAREKIRPSVTEWQKHNRLGGERGKGNA